MKTGGFLVVTMAFHLYYYAGHLNMSLCFLKNSAGSDKNGGAKLVIPTKDVLAL